MYLAKNVHQVKNVTEQRILFVKKVFASAKKTRYSGMKSQLLVVIYLKCSILKTNSL